MHHLFPLCYASMLSNFQLLNVKKDGSSSVDMLNTSALQPDRVASPSSQTALLLHWPHQFRQRKGQRPRGIPVRLMTPIHMAQTATKQAAQSDKETTSEKSHLFSMDPKLSSGIMFANPKLTVMTVRRLEPCLCASRFCSSVCCWQRCDTLYTAAQEGGTETTRVLQLAAKKIQRLSPSCGQVWLCGCTKR